MCQFDMARWVNGDLAVRTVVAPAPERQLRRLSPELVKVHEWLVSRQMVQAQSRSLSSAVSASEAVEQAGMGVSL
jgi:hypothetical protein